MAAFLDLCRFLPTLGGTTDFIYLTPVGGCQSPALAGAQNGVKYKCYAVSNDLTQWEIFEGAYNSATTTFPRTTVLYNSSGTGTATGQSGAGTKITFSTVPQVAVVGLAEDLISVEVANAFTATQKAQIHANIKVSGPTIQKLLSGTAATYTTPANCTWIRIRMVGAGGGGGPGGTTGATSGGNGGASTWSGGTLSAGGGTGGGQATAGGAGGTASGGNVANVNGADGSGTDNATSASSPQGASSILGGAGAGVFMGGAAAGGAAKANSGSGGGAGAASVAAGGAGGGAGAYVEHIISSPAATYTYTVGASAAGGSAGTSGTAGGASGAGQIIVEEYYN